MPHPFLSAESIGDRVYECFDLKAYVLHLIIWFQSFWCLVFQKKLVFNDALLLVSYYAAQIWAVNNCLAWKNRKSTVFNNEPLLVS